MKNKNALAALAMDLKRIALGLHRKSFRMVENFTREAGNRIGEIEMESLPPYVKHILQKIKNINDDDAERKADDMLMYSILIQNYSIRLHE